MQPEVGDREVLGVERAHDLGELLDAAAQPHGGRAGRAVTGVPKRPSTAATASRSSASAGSTSSVGRPISAFSSSGVPRGDDLARGR